MQNMRGMGCRKLTRHAGETPEAELARLLRVETVGRCKVSKWIGRGGLSHLRLSFVAASCPSSPASAGTLGNYL